MTLSLRCMKPNGGRRILRCASRNGVDNTLFKLLSLPLYCCMVADPVDGRSDIVGGAILAARLATVLLASNLACWWRLTWCCLERSSHSFN